MIYELVFYTLGRHGSCMRYVKRRLYARAGYNDMYLYGTTTTAAVVFCLWRA